MFLVQECRAPSDPNGNPRLLAVVYKTHRPVGSYCSIVDVYDLGYAGMGGLPDVVKRYRKLASTTIPYREWSDYHRHFEVIRI